jgi:hypothetical protein
MRLGLAKHLRLLTLLVATLVSIPALALATTNVSSGDVLVLGNSLSSPVGLSRAGSPVPVVVRVTANDGTIPVENCDGSANSVSVPQNLVLGAGSTMSGWGSNLVATFDCGRNFALSPQSVTLSPTVTADAGALLGAYPAPVSMGPAGGGSLLALGAELVPATASVTLHVRVSPRPPSNLEATPGNASVALKWQPSPDAADITDYVISRGTGLFQTPLVVPGSQTSFTDTGLENGLTYCYSIRARYVDAFSRRFQSSAIGPVCVVPVPYTFEGFYAPVDGSSVNAARAGQAVVLKWELFEGQDAVVDTANHALWSTEVPCDGSAGAGVAGPSDAAGSGGVRYDEEAGHYVYVWKTDKAWAGTCRRLTVSYGGVPLSALFSF